MRSAITILMGFVILISSTILVANRIDVTSRDIEAQLNQTEVLLNASQWKEASLLIEKSYSNWTELHNWWKIFLNHGILNNIEISYKKLEKYVQFQEKGDAMAELNTLTFLLQQVPESETLKFNNVL